MTSEPNRGTTPSAMKAGRKHTISGTTLFTPAARARTRSSAAASLRASAALFGVATLPGLTLAALLGAKVLAGGGRRWLLRLAGATLVVLGLLTVVRGIPAVHEWFHGHTVIPW